jgi:hypothetical protein
MPDLQSHSSRKSFRLKSPFLCLLEQKQAIPGTKGQTGIEINQQFTTYAEEARCIDEASKEFDRQMEQLDQKTWDDEVAAEEKLAEIEELEKQAKEGTKAFNEDVDKHRKSQLKEQRELQEQELKTMKLAERLAKNQVHADELELEQAQEAINKETEARLLAEDLVDEREEECRFAEQRMHELLRVEKRVRIFKFDFFN